MSHDDSNKYATGCLITPPPLGLSPVDAVQMASVTDVPDQFIVPYYRDLFDEEFKRLPDTPVHKPIKNQRGIPSCVGESVSYMKAASEGYEISGRDAYRQGKQRDGSRDPMSWGTSIWAVMDALNDTGIASESMVPDISNQPLATYVSLSDVTSAIEYDRTKNRSRRPYFVDRSQIVMTMWQQKYPVVTSCGWYTGDNSMSEAIMQAASGNGVGGHAFALIGVVRRAGVRCLVALNSWSEFWGDYGVFYIPLSGPAFFRLGDGCIALDIDPTLAELLERYNGKIVKTKTDARIWKIEGGKRRHIPNERVFFSMGYIFGQEQDISDASLKIIPEGTSVDLEETDPLMRERFRQIAQFYGH